MGGDLMLDITKDKEHLEACAKFMEVLEVVGNSKENDKKEDC